MVRRSDSVGAYDAKAHFSELLARVEGGEEITITRHGSPVARLVPLRSAATPAQRANAIARWRDTARNLTLGRCKVRDLIDEGRP